MNKLEKYCKRLIEVDLPVKKISALARHEKNLKEGHISTLHIWWARRPLAACRAVTLAALWPDPVDSLCPAIFKEVAANVLSELRNVRGGRVRNFADPHEIREALFEFIVQISDWEMANDPTLLAACRKMTKAAHEGLTGSNDLPVVADPFAGGGAIPFEALRVGASPFASDLNPIPIILNKTILEFLPRYGHKLIDQVEKSGQQIRAKLEVALAGNYETPKSPATPFAYLWARTVLCEGPKCGVRFPLVRSLWLRNKGHGTFAYSLAYDKKTNSILARIQKDPKPKDVAAGTSRQGAAICPHCGYTTPVERVRIQLTERSGGTDDSQLLSVCEVRDGQVGKIYREPSKTDYAAFHKALEKFNSIKGERDEWGSKLPDEGLNHLRGFFNVVLYGMTKWGDLFAPRQALLMMELVSLIRSEFEELALVDRDFAAAVATVLTLAAGKTAQYNSSCCRWKSKGETLVDMFGRQAIPMVWDYAEAFPFGETTGDYGRYVENACSVLRRSIVGTNPGTVVRGSATSHPLPDDSVDAFITDPPYYDAIPYADLSDYFYVWFRRALGPAMPELFKEPLTPKVEECVVLAHRAAMYRNKDSKFFESTMGIAMSEGRRITKPSGIGIVVFANKSTEGWEAMLSGLIDGGWVITGSWPIDTEMGSRLRARDSAVLSSSVHLVCRPRELPDGSLASEIVGDWREVLQELPTRIHEWLPRLAAEGVVGADAIFACLGPALEIFSRYSSVEKVSGERVLLREYLEHVWGAVSQQAISMIFESADAAGLEEDGRLTAMWLWTIAANVESSDGQEKGVEEDEEDEVVEKADSMSGIGFALEFDASRKIAQGLGASLTGLNHVVKIKGDKAYLISVVNRTGYLFGKPDTEISDKKKVKAKQISLFAELEESGPNSNTGELVGPKAGATTLDRLHQAMLLFGLGRADALKRFLVEDGVGKQAQFWTLAQSLSALYPKGTDEKRWVDGVLARKKGLGFG